LLLFDNSICYLSPILSDIFISYTKFRIGRRDLQSRRNCIIRICDPLTYLIIPTINTNILSFYKHILLFNMESFAFLLARRSLETTPNIYTLR